MGALPAASSIPCLCLSPEGSGTKLGDCALPSVCASGEVVRPEQVLQASPRMTFMPRNAMWGNSKHHAGTGSGWVQPAGHNGSCGQKDVIDMVKNCYRLYWPRVQMQALRALAVMDSGLEMQSSLFLRLRLRLTSRSELVHLGLEV